MARIRNSRTRRRVLATTGTALAGGLAGCTGTLPAGGDDSQFDESDPLVAHERFGKGSTPLTYQTSTFYTPIESESDQPAAAPALKAQHEEWAENHPDYRIEVEYPAFGEWKNNLLTRAASGDPPDGSTLDSFWVPDFYEYLQPLNEVVDDVDDFFPFVRETAMRDGDLLAGWKYTGCRCLYYRQDVLDRYNDGDPPRTWEGMLAVGGDIVDNEDMDGFMFEPGAFANLPYFWGQGGELVDEEGAPVLDEEANRRAMVRTLGFLQDLVESGVTPQRVASVEEVETLPREGRAGNLAMFIGNNDQIERNIKNPIEADDDVPDDRWQRWRVAQIPMREADQFATGVGGWAEGAFAEGTGGEAAAMKEFIAKFVEPESMGRYCEAASLLPTRESVFNDDDLYAPDTPYQDRFREFLQDGVARPAVPIYSTIATEYEAAIENVLTGQSDPESAVDTMISRVDEEYEAS
ncbi:MAG: extracellular solute-binding protein [Haloarculaceae archaeon]